MALNTDPLDKGIKVIRMASVDFISDSLGITGLLLRLNLEKYLSDWLICAATDSFLFKSEKYILTYLI